MRNVWVRLLAGVLSLGSGASVALGQEDELLQDDIDFGREIARFGYFDLSNDLLVKLEQKHTTKSAKVALSYAKASILTLAAQFASTPEARTQFYDQAISGYQSFLSEADPENKRMSVAQLEFGNLYISYGQFLRDTARELPPAESGPLTAKADEHFKNAITLMNQVYEAKMAEATAWVDVGEMDKGAGAYRDAFNALYQKGVCQFERALAFPADHINRTDYLHDCVETIEGFLFDNVETNVVTSYAYFYSGVANFELAKIEPDENSKKSYLNYAISSLQYVLDDQSWGIWTILDVNKGMDNSAKSGFATLAERASYRLAMVYNESDNGGEAVKVVEKLEAQRAKYTLGKPGYYGSLAILMKAEALREVGDFEQAIRLVQTVIEDNPGGSVATEAQKTLTGWLGGEGPGFKVPPDVLWNVAEGTYSEDRYLDAAKDYYRVLEAVVQSGDDKKRTEFAPKTWKRIGDCYSKQRRYLEAALAYETGLTEYPSALEDDQEQNARGFYNAWLQRAKETRTPFDEKQKDRARQIVATKGVGDLQFYIATDKFDEAEKANEGEKKALLGEAMSEFEKVEESSLFYERAWIYKARCQFEMGEATKALQTIDAYFAYTEDAINAPSSKEVRHRKIALADGSYQKALFQKELSNFEEVLKTFDGFEGKHPEMETYFVGVLFLQLDAKTALGDLEGAEKILADMMERYPKDSKTSFCMYRIAEGGYLVAYEKLKVAGNEQTPEARKLLERAADLMWQYSAASGHDRYRNLKLTGDWYAELGKPELAKRSYLKVLEIYDGNDRYRESIDTFVKRGLAEVLTDLHEFQDAAKWWDFYEPEKTPYREITRRAALCFGGWLEGEDGNYVEVPGSGDYERAVKLWGRFFVDFFRADAKDEEYLNYSPLWWDSKFMTIYSRYKASAEKPGHREAARKLFENSETLHPELGGGEIKRKFGWLRPKVIR